MSSPSDINSETSIAPKKVNLTIRVDQDVYALLVTISRREGRSISSQSNRFLRQAAILWSNEQDDLLPRARE